MRERKIGPASLASPEIPSPDLGERIAWLRKRKGWGQAERRGLRARAKADGVLALALIHHVAIAKNVPLGDVVGWLTDMAPRGVIEFVPKTDPMVVELLKLREDIFPHYNEEHFVKCLEARARIVRSETVSSSGRKLFAFERAVT